VALKFLEKLVLNSNAITGSIPTGIGKLQYLQTLDLYHNQMDGPLPESLYRLSNLSVIDVSSNDFSGTLSPNIGLLSKLQFLAIANTTMTGIFPESLGNLTKLGECDTYLSVTSNAMFRLNTFSLFECIQKVSFCTITVSAANYRPPLAAWKY